jgi:PleD family two-component response regulator
VCDEAPRARDTDPARAEGLGELTEGQYTLAPLGAGMGMTDYPGRVLIVDDEPHVRGLLRDFLTTVCDEVATAASGEEALEIVPMFQRTSF